MTTTTVFVLKGLNNDSYSGDLMLSEVVGVFGTKEKAENHRDGLVEAAEKHENANKTAEKLCRAQGLSIDSYNHAVMDKWYAVFMPEYNRILGTEGLKSYEEARRFFDGYEITEMSVL